MLGSDRLSLLFTSSLAELFSGSTIPIADELIDYIGAKSSEMMSLAIASSSCLTAGGWLATCSG